MPLDPTRIRALCFDVDGTLSDTDDLWTSRLEKALQPLRWMFPQRQTRAFARWVVMGIESPGNMAYWWLDWMRLDDNLARFYSARAKRAKRKAARPFWIIPGVKEMLEALYQRYPLAVVSARDEDSTLAFLEQFGLRGLFRAVATSQTCEHTKPYPDPVVWAAAQLGAAPGECLMIGDTTVDIRAGRAAGAQTVGVLCGFGHEREMRRAGADLILPSTADLTKTLIQTAPQEN